MSTPLKFIKANEPIWLSWARDAVTFGGLLGTAVGLNTLMEPSGWLNFALGFTWILWMFGRAHRLTITMTPDEAREWLDREYPKGGDA